MATATPTPPSKKPPVPKKPENNGSASRRLSSEELSEPPTSAAVDPFARTEKTGSPKVGGRTPQNLPTTNPITFSSPPSASTNPSRPGIPPPGAKKQAKTLGNLIGGQQADARAADPDYGPNESEEDQSSVLDAADPNKFQEEESMYYDGDPTTPNEPEDDTKTKNAKWMKSQQLAQQRQDHFISPNRANDGSSRDTETGGPPGDPNRPKASTFELMQRSAKLLRQQQAAATMQDAAEQSRQEGELAQGVAQLKNDMLHKAGVSESQLVELGGRLSTLMTAGTGVGLLYAAPKANITAMNRYINSRLLIWGYRSPEEREQNSGTKYLDMIDVAIAVVVDLIVTWYLLPVIGIVAIIVTIAMVAIYADQLGPILGNLVTLLAI